MCSLYSLTLLSFSLLTASMTYSISNWSRIIAYVLLLLLPALRMCTPRPLVAINTKKYRNKCWQLWWLDMYLLLMLAELPNAAAISGSRSIMRSRFSASWSLRSFTYWETHSLKLSPHREYITFMTHCRGSFDISLSSGRYSLSYSDFPP